MGVNLKYLILDSEHGIDLSAKQLQLLTFVLPTQRAERELHLTGLEFFDCSLALFASVVQL